MTSTQSIRIVVADESKTFREGLILILDSQADISVVGECSSAQEALHLIATLRPDLTILGLRLSSLGGFKTLGAILNGQPSARILILSELDANDETNSAREAGVSGYLPKESGRSELFHAIRNICAGCPYFPACA